MAVGFERSLIRRCHDCGHEEGMEKKRQGEVGNEGDGNLAQGTPTGLAQPRIQAHDEGQLANIEAGFHPDLKGKEELFL